MIATTIGNFAKDAITQETGYIRAASGKIAAANGPAGVMSDIGTPSERAMAEALRQNRDNDILVVGKKMGWLEKVLYDLTHLFSNPIARKRSNTNDVVVTYRVPTSGRAQAELANAQLGQRLFQNVAEFWNRPITSSVSRSILPTDMEGFAYARYAFGTGPDPVTTYGYQSPVTPGEIISAGVAVGSIVLPLARMPGPSTSAFAAERIPQVTLNKAVGDAFEADVIANVLPKTQVNIQPQITIKSSGPSGLKVRLDALGEDMTSGATRLSDMKASSTAPFSPNQTVVYPELELYGGVVVGKGKAPYIGGTNIPPTAVDVIRKVNR